MLLHNGWLELKQIAFRLFGISGSMQSVVCFNVYIKLFEAVKNILILTNAII